MNSDFHYSIDASALMDGWRRYHPPEVFPTLWNRLEDLINTGRLKTPEHVKLELARYDDDLFKWASDHKEIFIPMTAELEQRVSLIVNKFPSFVPERSPDGIWADPYVIAAAQEINGYVVTGEKLVDANARYLRIPNICDSIGVEWFTLLDLMRNENWRF